MSWSESCGGRRTGQRACGAGIWLSCGRSLRECTSISLQLPLFVHTVTDAAVSAPKVPRIASMALVKCAWVPSTATASAPSLIVASLSGVPFFATKSFRQSGTDPAHSHIGLFINGAARESKYSVKPVSCRVMDLSLLSPCCHSFAVVVNPLGAAGISFSCASISSCTSCKISVLRLACRNNSPTENNENAT